jgi:hypothetical protein
MPFLSLHQSFEQVHFPGNQRRPQCRLARASSIKHKNKKKKQKYSNLRTSRTEKLRQTISTIHQHHNAQPSQPAHHKLGHKNETRSKNR